MSNPDGYPGSRRALPVQGGVDRYEALLQVLEQQAGRASRGGSRRAHGQRGFRIFLVVALFGITVWLWVFPPAGLVPSPNPPASLAQEEASLRLGMYLQAQRIEAYRLEHGYLPETMAEAGEGLPGLQYMVVDEGVYQITGQARELRLTYRSDRPLRDWVGTGADVLEREAAR